MPNKTAIYGLSMKKSLHSRGLPRVYTSVAFLAGNLPPALVALLSKGPFVSKWCSQQERTISIEEEVATAAAAAAAE